jgi:hypothetical protein
MPRSHDNASWNGNDRFNSLWLELGHELSLLQRVGFIFISLVFLIPGTVCLICAWDEVKSSISWFVLWFVAAIVLLYFGCRGVLVAITAPSKSKLSNH